MKKRLFRLICALILCCSFGLGGCLGSMSGGAGGGGIEPPSDDLLNSSNNAENIIATKDNVTYYYESLEDLNADIGKEATDRNNLKHTFGDAYVFVDPGPDYEILDHYTDTYAPYFQLVGRQVELLTDILYTAINRIYLDGTIKRDSWENNVTGNEGKRYAFGYYTTDHPDASDGEDIYNFGDGQSITSETLQILDVEPPEDAMEYMDLSNPYSFSVFAGLDTQDAWQVSINEHFGASHLLEDDPETPGNDAEPIVINSYIFNLQYAVLGGLKFDTGNYIKIQDGTSKYYANFYNEVKEDNLNFEDGDDYKWKIVGTAYEENIIESTKKSLKESLRMCIASALSGIETNGSWNVDEFINMVKTIDHLGFTETDKLNIKNSILDNIIGSKVIKKDENNFKALKSSGLFSISSQTKVVADKSAFSTLFYDSGAPLDSYDWQNYKGYNVVIDAIVEQAMNVVSMEGTEVGEGVEDTNETLFPGFPRAQIIKMDSWDLMDKQAEEGDDNISEDEEIDPDDIPTDAESIKFEEKFDKFYRIIGILLMPKKVYGERTMAVKEDDQWVKDSEGNVKTTTFNVEGFILTGSDLVVLSEEDKMTSYQLNYEIHTPNKHINVESSVAEAGFVKPEPTEEAVYNSTETLDIDKQEIIEKTEDEIEEYRLLGYDGLRITDEARLLDFEDNDKMIEGLEIEKKGKHSYIKMTTELYHYIGVGDVNGDNGTTFAGYVLDLSKFAGNSYVVTNFPILAVNGNEEDRDAKMNILYFYLDCI